MSQPNSQYCYHNDQKAGYYVDHCPKVTRKENAPHQKANIHFTPSPF